MLNSWAGDADWFLGDQEEETCLTYCPQSIKEILPVVQGTITSGTSAEQIVVSFDLDDTLWRLFDFTKELKVPPELDPDLQRLTDIIRSKNLVGKASTHNFLIEPDAPETLQEIANLGVKLMATTSRFSTADSIDQTERTLEHLGIDFNQMMGRATNKSPIQLYAADLLAENYFPFCQEARDTKPKFTETGVLFTSGHNKGESLKEYLIMQRYKEQNITHFFHIDDFPGWCQSVHEYLNPIDIATTCFRFYPRRYDFCTAAEINRYSSFIQNCTTIF